MDISYVLVPLVIALAFFGEAIFGFGGGLVSIPLISLLLGVKDAVTLVLIFQLLMGLLIFKSYKHIDVKSAMPMTITVIVGAIVGTLLLSQASVVFLQLFLAAAILLFLAKTTWFNGFTLGKGHSSLKAGTTGLAGGLFQGLIGTGGPIITMYLSVAVKHKSAVRATLIWLLFVSSLFRLWISIPQHLISERVLHLAYIALPFFLVAIVIGQILHKQVSTHYYRLGINVALAVSAGVLVGKALF